MRSGTLPRSGAPVGSIVGCIPFAGTHLEIVHMECCDVSDVSPLSQRDASRLTKRRRTGALQGAKAKVLCASKRHAAPLLLLGIAAGTSSILKSKKKKQRG